MNRTPRIDRGAIFRLAISIGCLAVVTPAGAQTTTDASPYYIGASLGYTHDSNVNRTRPGSEVADSYLSYGVLGGVNLRFGRQRVFADVDAQVNRYQEISGLNNKSYAVTGGLDWETIETLSGTLRYIARNNLATFSTGAGGIFVSDQQSQQFAATARYGLPSQVTLDIGYDHRLLEVASASDRDFTQDTVSAGVRWAVGGKLTLGAGVRASRGEQQTVPVDETRRRDIDLTATYATGSFSTFNARLSATKETHSLATATDISETTGALSWSYRPTGRFSFNLSATRDTGRESTFSTATAGDGSTDGVAVDSTRLGTTFALDGQYELTGKISLNGNLRQRKGTLGSSGSETFRGYGVGFSYLPTRSVALRCSVGREDRSIGGTTAYEVTITGCTGELTFR
ncbi:hypothetical protein [Piscinibacter gummiphilus]|uniref:Outer membrane beta-barrel protein n=1 Tax=Piscinibacter gummiphilus TaxID=946333 RepID=A0ABZ0CQK2_9BURK|nr:hypothetical protein [Piscinibacter gummiphilus]WOB07263.1 hypothetical protein RXV79_20375 [Piscinibacter gummiphilus]